MPRHKVEKSWALTDHKFEAEQRHVRRLGRICFWFYTAMGVIELSGIVIAKVNSDNPNVAMPAYITTAVLCLITVAFMIFSELRGWTKMEIHPYDYNMSSRGYIYDTDLRFTVDEKKRKQDICEHIIVYIIAAMALIGLSFLCVVEACKYTL